MARKLKHIFITIIAITGCISLIPSVYDIIYPNQEEPQPIHNQQKQTYNLIKQWQQDINNHAKHTFPDGIHDTSNPETYYNNYIPTAVHYLKDIDPVLWQTDNDKGWFYYQKLTERGTTQTAVANITYNVRRQQKNTKRPDFNSSTIAPGQYTNAELINPTDPRWQTTSRSQSNNQEVSVSIDNINYHGWFYNKSHLIAWSLGGSMSPNNIILGTRAQNVGTNNNKNPGGMSYIETIVRNYLDNHANAQIIYLVIPMYRHTTDLLPTLVYVEAVDLFNPSFQHAAWTLNIQQGFTINYETGVFEKTNQKITHIPLN